MNTETKKEPRNEAFVKYVICCLDNDKGAAAALRRADIPSMEHQSWEFLARFNVDLKNPNQRLPFGLIAASIVKGKVRQNGSLGIGEAIARCYENGNKSDQAKAKLRRVLACDTVIEICAILRPMLRLIEAKCLRTLNYARLLNDILYLETDPQQTKSKWAQNFYRSNADEEASL